MRARTRISRPLGLLCAGLLVAACGDGSTGANNNDGPELDRTYHLSITSSDWSEPEGIGSIIGSYVPDFLLDVVDVTDTGLQLVGAVTQSKGEPVQDLCRETIAFPTAPLEADGSFVAGPVAFPIEVSGYEVTIHDLTISGTFSPDATALLDASFEGVLDAREFEGFFGTDADGVCNLVAGVGAACEACPGDGEPYCLTLRAGSLSAAEVSGLTVQELSAADIDPACDPTAVSCTLGDKLLAHESGAFTGYTLFAPIQSTTTYLIDICGEVVHTWESDYNPGQSVYLLDNGHLLRTASAHNQSFNPGGAGGYVEELDWDGTRLWYYEYSSTQHCLHHDIERLPNGNLLMIAWEKKTEAEALAAGRNPNLLNFGELWPDHIIEVKPTYPEGGTIVWEWHVWDHLIQDYDPSRDNYGDVAWHPERFDLNFTGSSGGPGGGGADWNHINAIDYNPALDQILISFHTTSEIVIIDHSTTTTEAATSTGGTSGKGGDILYRWGNPQAYRAGLGGDQVLFGQHDAQWIVDGLSGEGDILLFNNGMNRGFSTVDQLVPPVDSDGAYPLAADDAWGPLEAIWSYQAPTPSDFFSPMISGAQRLENGNTLICSGQNGYFFEVESDGREVWRYHADAGPVFRIYRYAPDYPGLANLER